VALVRIEKRVQVNFGLEGGGVARVVSVEVPEEGVST
jgi:hypothetical protein